ncbi:MAG: hypothetical protein ABF695_12250 [Liquorilactobacillus ghanensis]|uniref:hypothetical protein n=1 Tax=Liquorilactobacillus ghanensis TaxID=399370 RepID=UPI0039EB0DEB
MIKNKRVELYTLGIIIIVSILTYFKLLVFDNHYSISDIISLFVLVVSLSVAYVSYRQFLVQLDTKKKQQANKIAAWLLPENRKKDYEGIDSSKPHTFIPRTVQIRNSSSVPVYDVYVFSGTTQSEEKLFEMNFDPTMTVKINVLPPKTGEFRIKTGGSAMHQRSAISILFRDANSKIWFRGIKGNLFEVNESDYNRIFTDLGVPNPMSPIEI